MRMATVLGKFHMAKVIATKENGLCGICTPRNKKAWADAKRLDSRLSKKEIEEKYYKVVKNIKMAELEKLVHDSIYGERKDAS